MKELQQWFQSLFEFKFTRCNILRFEKQISSTWGLIWGRLSSCYACEVKVYLKPYLCVDMLCRISGSTTDLRTNVTLSTFLLLWSCCNNGLTFPNRQRFCRLQKVKTGILVACKCRSTKALGLSPSPIRLSLQNIPKKNNFEKKGKFILKPLHS